MLRNKKIVVTMTSYPKRIDKIKPAINSILSQTIKPDKFILWLAKSEFENGEKDLPKFLTDLAKNKKITIEWCNDIKSNKKYFYALQKYPDDIIITTDDDLIQKDDMLECLLKSYLKYPNAISAIRTHLMKRNGNKFSGYMDFVKEQNDIINIPSMELLATTGAGTLIPPKLINTDYFSEDFVRNFGIICDDILLKLYTAISDVPVVQPRKFNKLKIIPNTQEDCLWKKNKLPTGNDKTLEDIRLWCNSNFGENILISKIFGNSEEKSKSKTILYFAPHQDDELLTMGIDIAKSIEKGEDVHVILCVNGSKSGVKTTLNNGGNCGFHDGQHIYDLSVNDFIFARDREFFESCICLGVPPSNIHIYPKRPSDRELTVKTAQNIILKYLNMLGKNAKVCTIWHNNGKDQHIDHKNLGRTVHNLYKSGKIKSVRFFKEPYCKSETKFRKQKATPDIETKILNAINSYSKWEPDKNKYAVGYHSVMKFFNNLKKKMCVFYFDIK